MTTRLTAEHRREQIIQAAKHLSYGGGLYDWSLDDVAQLVGISRPGVRYYFHSVQKLRRRTINDAITGVDLDIVTQAVAKHDPLVKDIPNKLRQACGKFLTS